MDRHPRARAVYDARASAQSPAGPRTRTRAPFFLRHRTPETPSGAHELFGLLRCLCTLFNSSARSSARDSLSARAPSQSGSTLLLFSALFASSSTVMLPLSTFARYPSGLERQLNPAHPSACPAPLVEYPHRTHACPCVLHNIGGSLPASPSIHTRDARRVSEEEARTLPSARSSSSAASAPLPRRALLFSAVFIRHTRLLNRTGVESERSSASARAAARLLYSRRTDGRRARFLLCALFVLRALIHKYSHAILRRVLNSEAFVYARSGDILYYTQFSDSAREPSDSLRSGGPSAQPVDDC
ncbi:hypothetical protein FB451DRAFT_1515717 [Mycena latifolia]|nr:hypothetical protein FB451DRAFT_1515717 [Mycena latifolia]